MTGLAGLPVYMDLASVMGLNEGIERHLHIKQQSLTDSQTLLSIHVEKFHQRPLFIKDYSFAYKYSEKLSHS